MRPILSIIVPTFNSSNYIIDLLHMSFMNINIKNVSLILGSSFIITFIFEKLYGFVSNYSTETSSFSEDIISNQLNGGVNLAINILLFTLIFLIGVNICLNKTLRLNDKTIRIVKTSLYC